MKRRLYNLISLEFSDTPLAELVTAPSVVRAVDCKEVVWPKFRVIAKDYPKVLLAPTHSTPTHTMSRPASQAAAAAHPPPRPPARQAME